MNEYVETLPEIRWHEPRSSYDVVIVGGGGHGLSTAYYLATRHGITNVAVLEADYIASGNTGRNTTIIRANYGIPEAIRFYQHSLELYQGLEAETGCCDHAPDQGHLLGRPHGDGDAHRAGALPDEHGLRREDVHGHAAAELKELCPAGRPDRRRPLPGARRLASRRGRDGPPRPGRVGVRRRARRPRRPRRPAHPGDRAPPRRRAGRRGPDGRRHRSRPASCCRAVGGRVTRDGGPRRRPAAGPHPPAPRVRHQRLRAGLRAHLRQHGARLLRVADRARPDAHRRRVRLAAVATRASRRSPRCASYSYKITRLLPFLRDLRILRTVGRDLRHLARTTRRSWAPPASTASSSRRAGGRGASRPSRPAARGWPS